MIRRAFFKLRHRLYRAVIVPKFKQHRTCPSEDHDVFKHTKRKSRQNTANVTHITIFGSFDLNVFKVLGLTPSINAMDSVKQQFKPPACVKGMTTLDRSKFDDTVKVPAITVPVKNLQKVTKQLKKYGLKLKGFSPVVELEKCDPDFNSHKRYLLDPRKMELLNQLPDEIKNVLANENTRNNDIEIVDLKMSYSNWNFQEVMQAIMPDDCDNVTGFSEVGHIAHFNLRDQALPYKHIIGEVLLDKVPGVKTVVNKLNTIDNTFRTFQMELMAGEDNFVTQAKENGFTFELDFSKVYWNSRLGTEHHRMTKNLKYSDIVFDVFAGVGPFSVPATKRRATVYANDLNPYSYESLVKNIKLNNCDSSLITCSNLDGREFIETVVKDRLTAIYSEGTETEEVNVANISGIAVLMNLPALAYTFLDAFKGLLSGVENFNDKVPLPVAHCYCFTNLADASEKWGGDMNVELKHRVIDVIGGLKEEDITLRFVRDVAPQKWMMCVSFKLTREILCGTSTDDGSYDLQTYMTDEPPAKCQKLDVEADVNAV
ncbi:tRNA (guanine(37)-N1)-methyltransferase-like [Mercenaria mercenaria]|uniref:tRNA (guanine(37)-N1)-methyltransferase-like n=1 Tax=Mercenaria mercenaria TaxID=6596 RepID=UPI00234EDE68|nr:tRNA (guanine(37)-N1)-methyltransferase-like [Mercenaria mercenaria]